MHATSERRRKDPSYTTPFVFEGLEIVLIWIVIGIFESTLNIMHWSFVSYLVASVWFVYTFKKLKKVLDRQTMHRR